MFASKIISIVVLQLLIVPMLPVYGMARGSLPDLNAKPTSTPPLRPDLSSLTERTGLGERGNGQSTSSTLKPAFASLGEKSLVGFMRIRSSSAFQSSGCGVSTGCGNLTYHGGPVMHSPADFLIFWLPPGYHFDNNTIDPTATNPSDSSYEQLIARYFSDICEPNQFYNLLQQYPDTNGPIGSCSLGGSWIDNSTYSGGRGSQSNPLTDSDVQNEVSKAISANAWSANNGNSEFFVFTGYNVYSCAGTGCSFTNFCAYHSYFYSTSGSVIYADMPDPGTVCGVGTSPNNDLFADYSINIISHEQFEAFTDPTFGGWFYQDLYHEIGDECAWIFGASGATLLIGADYYRAQMEWSNNNHGCQGSFGSLYGQYWKDTFFGTPLPSPPSCAVYNSPTTPASPPTNTTIDPTIMFGSSTGWQWAPLGSGHEFSVRWSGSINIATQGTYSFQLASDDGSWLYLDSSLVINHGGLHSPTDTPGTASFSLSRGLHQIEIDYYETCASQAGIDFSWTPPGANGYATVPSLVFASPPELDGKGVSSGSCALSSRCQVLSTSNGSDVVIVIASCTYNSQCVGLTPLVSDNLGLQFIKHGSYCYNGSVFTSCLWEYYAVATSPLTNDNITAIPNQNWPGSWWILAFGVSGANTVTIFDPNLPREQHCSAADGNPANCTVDFVTSSTPSLPPYDFLFAITSINDAPACNSPPSQGWIFLNERGGYLESEYQVGNIVQTGYSFTCPAYSDPLILLADGIQSQGLSDFSTTGNPSIVTTDVGSAASSVINITSMNGFHGTLNLSLNSPASASCSLSSATINLGSSGTSSLTCLSNIPGNFIVTVTATSPAISHMTSITFVLQDFTISTSVFAKTVDAGESANYTVTLASVNGLSGIVNLTNSSSPAGLRCGLSPASLYLNPNLSGTSVLSCQGPGGSYNVTISARSDTLVHALVVKLYSQDFALSSSTPVITIVQGLSANSTVTLYSLGGFSKVVNVILSWSPSGLQVTSVPTSIGLSAGGAALVMINVSSSASTPAGNYTVTVTGVNETLSHSLVLKVAVQQSPSVGGVVLPVYKWAMSPVYGAFLVPAILLAFLAMRVRRSRLLRSSMPPQLYST